MSGVKDRQSIEVELNQEAVYMYIEEHPNTTAKECVEALQLFEKGKRYLLWLTKQGHITCDKKVVNGRRQCTYKSALPYVRPTYEAPNNLTNPQQEVLKNATTVYRLIDKPRPVQKAERPKRRRSVSIGSGLTMFDSF